MDAILRHIISGEVKNVLIDCDTGADGDDQFALAYALAAPDRVNVLGVCSEPFNDNPAAMSAAGAKENKTIALTAGCDIPSAVGAGDYITKRGSAVDSEAVNLICSCADYACESGHGPLYVVMSGCCTNVASALMLHPELKEKIVAVWLAMADIYGENTGAEYNFMNDPAAGQYLINCGIPTVLIPTRLIYPFAASKDDIDRRFGMGTPLCRLLTQRFREITWAKGLWDLGAEGALILPSAYEWRIVDAPELDSAGNVLRFDKSRSMLYAAGLDTDAVWADAVRRIRSV